MARSGPLAACDCETDPFLHGRVPRPFIWGFYDGKSYEVFHDTQSFVNRIKDKNYTLYAHNGGKFDFMYLLPFVGYTRAQIINGRIVSMKLGETTLIDSFAAVPESLAKIKKREIEMWKMEKTQRQKYMAEIIHYLEGDCVYLYELMEAYRREAGKKKTIASNALDFAQKLGLKPGKTNYAFDSNFREFYYGGRTQCFLPGEHKNIRCYDIHSAYPFAMTHDHPSGAARNTASSLKGLSHEQIQRSFIRLECFSNGAFPLRTKTAAGLDFPVEKNIFRVTGWEYLAAKELNLIKDVSIIEVKYCDETINFTPYVTHWYDYKSKHDKSEFPIEYTIGKFMMNSLYGKLAQNPERYFDYKIVEDDYVLPCSEAIEDDEGYCKICGYATIDHGWTSFTRFEGKRFIRRETMWKYRMMYGDELESKPLYKNVATGASITGFTRAHLLRAIHSVGAKEVIYCDTDSIYLTERADISGLSRTNNLGDWGLEIENAPLGYFTGKKQYAIEIDPSKPCNCADNKCKKHKVVSKGAKLVFRDFEKLMRGEKITYRQEAPTFSIARGIHFPIREIKSTAKSLDKNILVP